MGRGALPCALSIVLCLAVLGTLAVISAVVLPQSQVAHSAKPASHWHDNGSTAMMHHRRAIRPCQPHEVVLQQAMMQTAINLDGRWLPCPSFSWMANLPAAITDETVVWFDIGCNKGFDTALMHEVFQLRGLSRRRLGDLYRGMNEPDCGACDDCNERPLDHVREPMHPVRRPQKLVAHCFEPSPNNFQRLGVVHSKLAPEVQQHWNLHSVAFSNVTNQQLRFSANCSSELCMILGPNDMVPGVNVPVVTVDAMAAQLNVPHIHILKIDTEGHDPLVLQGARGLLSRKAVDVLLFEYHGQGPWRTTQLKHVVEELHSFGYVCFFEGRPVLTQITACWSDAFEFHTWSNVVCAAQGTAALRLLASKSYRSLLD